METKFNIVGWSLVVIGALIFSFVFMQDSPAKCSASVWETITTSFLTFAIPLLVAIMMIGFAKLWWKR